MKKIIKLFIGFIFAAFFIWIIAKNVNYNELINTFTHINFFYILLAVMAFMLGYACRIQRWRLMLMHENKKISWSYCAGPFMASVAVNNVLPFRAGDILRAFGFNKKLHVSASATLTSLVVERLLDLLMVVSFFGIALIVFGMESSKFIRMSGGVLVFLGIIILFSLLFPCIFKVPIFWICRKICYILPKFGLKLVNGFEKIFAALEYTSKSSIILKLLLWSFASWLGEGFVFYSVAFSIPSLIHTFAAWAALPVGSLATIIPSTPGFVGTFDYFTTETMRSMGNSPESSVAFAFVVHTVLWLPPTLIGGIYCLMHSINPQIHNRKK